MTTTTPKPRRRRWSQFSLKSLMVLVVIVAVPCGWLKWKIDRKAKERAAVAAIQKVGGEVFYDWESEDYQDEPHGPAWLRNVLGDDFFSSVDTVHLMYLPGITNEWLIHLEPLTDLSDLPLDDTQITDDGLRYLARFKKLKALSLSGTGVTDAGLAYLKGLTELADLALEGTAVTDVGLVNLKGLTGLKKLTLSHTAVTDAGLTHLKGLADLEYLFLSNVDVTDAGLVHLKGLTNLKWLWIDGDGWGIAVQSYPAHGPRVTDTGLLQLYGLSKLEYLMLSTPPVTEDGIVELQKAMPHCRVDAALGIYPAKDTGQ